jgi:hypothetical protein
MITFLGARAQKISPLITTTCHGSKVQYTLSEYYVEDKISWQYSYDQNGTFTKINGATNSTLFLETAQFNINNTIYVQAVINDVKKSNIASISFASVIKFQVNEKFACVNKLNKFTATSDQNLVYSWYLNNNLIGLDNVIYYVPDTAGNYILKVVAQNEFGCKDSLRVNFHVNKPPNVEVQIPKIICGNGTEVASMIGDTDRINVTGLTIWDGENKYSNSKYSVKKIGNSFEITWIKPDKEKQLKIQVDYIADNECSYSAASNFLLLQSVNPQPGEVFRKDLKSNLLIYSPKSKDDVLNYGWGYTNLEGKDIPIQAENRQYALYPDLNSKSVKKFWVDVSFLNSSYCSTRIDYDPIKDSKYQIALNAKIYPNPASNFLNIETPPNSGRISVSVYRLDGVLVLSNQFDNSTGLIQMNIHELENGLYNFWIYDSNCKEYSKTVLINKLH